MKEAILPHENLTGTLRFLVTSESYEVVPRLPNSPDVGRRLPFFGPFTCHPDLLKIFLIFQKNLRAKCYWIFSQVAKSRKMVQVISF
jgi:hypothetical protein